MASATSSFARGKSGRTRMEMQWWRRCLTVFGLLVAASGAMRGTDCVAEPRAEVERWLTGWDDHPPTRLGADWRGPFWTRRFGQNVTVERYSAGRSQEIRGLYVPIPTDLPARLFDPTLVRGDAIPPEAMYQLDHNQEYTELDTELERRHGPTLGFPAFWEEYSSWRSGRFQFSAAFGIDEDGFSVVALFPGAATPFVADLRPAPQGVWAPQALVSSSKAFVVFNAFGVAPAKGIVLTVESMDLAAFQAQRVWNPTRLQYATGEPKIGWGDPAVCLDEAGIVHWASVLWDNSVAFHAKPTGRILVDDVELVQRGMTGEVDWQPELVWVRGRGLVMTIAGPAGTALVGEVHGNQFVQLAELPSVAPAFSRRPPTHLASVGASYFVATSEGLWAHDVRPPVPAWSPIAGWIAAAALALVALALGRRRSGRLVSA
jgi:hypothetical protein